MKKVILAIIVGVLLVGCGSLNKLRPRITKVYIYDFRPYVEKGFWISTADYHQEYTPVAEMYMVIYPGQKEIPNTSTGYGDGGTTIVTEALDSREVIDNMVDSAKKLGADGIAFFYSTVEYMPASPNIYTPPGVFNYTARGLAIKRKNVGTMQAR